MDATIGVHSARARPLGKALREEAVGMSRFVLLLTGSLTAAAGSAAAAPSKKRAPLVIDGSYLEIKEPTVGVSWVEEYGRFVRHVVRRNQKQIRRCYQREAANHPRTAGEVIISVTINASGRVTNARVSEDPLTTPVVGRCLVRWLQSAARFPRVRGGGSVAVRFPFLYPPGYEGRQRRLIREYVGGKEKEVSRCYEQVRARKPKLDAGQVQLDWTMDAEGVVSGVKVTRDYMDDPAAGRCLTRVVGGWRFPPTTNFGVVEVHGWPFDLGPQAVALERRGPPGGQGGSGPIPIIETDVVTTVPPYPELFIRRALRRQWHAIQSCYGRELARSPEVNGKTGRFSAYITISNDGRVERVGDFSMTVSDQAVTRCLVGNIERWQLPPPQGGKVKVYCGFTLGAETPAKSKGIRRKTGP